MSKKKIIFIELDCFYASIEQRDNPDLKGKPVAVGDSNKQRGVIANASIEARKYGITTAMATRNAKKKCTRLVIVPPRFDVYKSVSKQIRGILNKYCDTVEQNGLDKAFLDVTETGLDFTGAAMLARRIKEEIKRKTELTASVGVAANKFLAEIASTLQRPDGMYMLTDQNAQLFVDDLPIDRFSLERPNVKKMHRLGIKKGGDMKKYNKSEMILHFGKNGLRLFNLCHAIDERPVVPDYTRTGQEATKFIKQGIKEKEDIIIELHKLCTKISKLMTPEEMVGCKVQLKMRYASYKTLTRNRLIEKLPEGENFLTEMTKFMFDSVELRKPIHYLRVRVAKINK